MKLPPPIRNILRANKLIRFLYFDCHLADIPVALGIGSFERRVNSAIEKFTSPSERLNEEAILKLKKDIKQCYYHYKIIPEEYFLFKLRGKSKSERAEYLSDHMIMKLVADKTGRRIHDVELNDKFNFYSINKPFFKREAFFCSWETTLDSFKEFAISKGKFIAKPNGAALGCGVEILSVDNEIEAGKIYEYLKSKKVDYILEELIIQSGLMAVWNQSSVNTIRINSFLTHGKFNVHCPFIRTGRKGSIVDNGGQGGIFASIDKTTGRICTDGMDESGNIYVNHPDSKIQYKNWQVPAWGELIHLVEQVHRNMPEHIYVSWDFALTDNGWALIEGNWGEFVCQQMTNQRGYKKDFIRLLNSK